MRFPLGISGLCLTLEENLGLDFPLEFGHNRVNNGAQALFDRNQIISHEYISCQSALGDKSTPDWVETNNTRIDA